jgi:hypothetical protein
MSQTVLFAGGPLHGQTTVIRDGTWNVVAPVPRDLTDPSADPFAELKQVAYTFAKLVICGRMILIGHLGSEPDEALVFEVITSDAAKEASSVPDWLASVPS